MCEGVAVNYFMGERTNKGKKSDEERNVLFVVCFRYSNKMDQKRARIVC